MNELLSIKKKINLLVVRISATQSENVLVGTIGKGRGFCFRQFIHSSLVMGLELLEHYIKVNKVWYKCLY